MIVYVGKDYRCHADPGEGLEAVADAFFDGKCDAFIEGYCMEADEQHEIQKIYPWKDLAILAAYQEQCERMGGASAEVIEKAEAYDILTGVSE